MSSLANVSNDKQTVLIAAVVWLFHISAIIGISLGYEQWFIERTPLNLMIIASALFLSIPINSFKMIVGFVIFLLVGMFSEYLGVQYGLIFGEYNYGNNLGPKLAGVPYLIGINWAVLVTISASISTSLHTNRFIRAAIGAGIMVLLDLVMEPVAPIFDFWEFTGGTPGLQNYLGWFGVGYILQLAYPYFFKSNNKKAALHIFLAQFIFFAYFSLWYTIIK